MINFQSWFNFFDQFPWIFNLSTLIVGVCIGSFLNVVIFRLPLMICVDVDSNDSVTDKHNEPQSSNGLNLAFPRSFCPNCLGTLSWRENIPILSYLSLKGRCQKCSVPISLRYPAIELITGVLTLLLGFYFGCTLKFFYSCFFIYALIALCFIDLNTFLLPDAITLPLIWSGMFVNSFGVFASLQESFYGAVFGYLILWLIFWIFKILTGKNGFGYGDFKLLAALGAWLGWEYLPFIVFISSLTGSVVGLSLLALKRIDKNTPIPFGPYLILGGVVMLFCPQLKRLLG
jgi:leader peptidase (prepilin peptidase)/N-methyltransferase